VGCLAAADGRSLWTVNVRTKFGGRGTEFGFASTPLVEDGRVILPVGGPGASMVALNAANGSTLWTSGDEPASYCPAFPMACAGRRLVVGFLQNSLVVHDCSTGERVWRERVSSSYDEHAAWPLFDGRDLLIASPFRVGAQLFRFSVADGITGKLVWSNRQLSNDVCSSLLVDGSVYGFDLQQLQASAHRPSRGTFKCLEFATGKLRWETSEVGQASPLWADGKLILWTESGTLVLARSNPDRYEELTRAKLLGGGGMCWAAPALCGKRLFVRDHKRAACIYLGPPTDLDPSRLTASLIANETAFAWRELVPQEPDFPNDEPTAADVGHWFAYCVGAFGMAAAVALLLRIRFSKRVARFAFAIVAFGLGAVGTTVLGAWAETFVLTWPVSLFVAFRVALSVGLARTAVGWRHQVLARLALVGFAVLCFGYYRLCLVVGYAMAWSFLAGFLPAAPFAVCAAKTQRIWLRLIADVVGFTIYFWASGLLPGWIAAWSE
jgi:hypothetical protein